MPLWLKLFTICVRNPSNSSVFRLLSAVIWLAVCVPAPLATSVTLFADVICARAAFAAEVPRYQAYPAAPGTAATVALIV